MKKRKVILTTNPIRVKVTVCGNYDQQWLFSSDTSYWGPIVQWPYPRVPYLQLTQASWSLLWSRTFSRNSWSRNGTPTCHCGRGSRRLLAGWLLQHFGAREWRCTTRLWRQAATCFWLNLQCWGAIHSLSFLLEKRILVESWDRSWGNWRRQMGGKQV